MKSEVLLALLAAVVAVAPSILAVENFGPEFAALKTQYDLRVRSEVQQVFDAAIADLNAKYTAMLDRTLETAQKAGRLDDAVALKAEVEAIAQGKGVPATDDNKAPATLKQVRDVYRASASRIDLDRAKKLQPLQTAFAKSLDPVVTNLTSAGKLDEATALRKYRDALTAPVPPPVVFGSAASGSLGGVGDAAKDHLVTREILIAKTWRYRLGSDTRTWTFNADKTMTSTSGSKATWSIRGKTLRLDWGANNINEFSLELQPSAGELILNGVDGSGKPNGKTMTQLAK